VKLCLRDVDLTASDHHQQQQKTTKRRRKSKKIEFPTRAKKKTLNELLWRQ
jgi:hypothetical protein